MFKFITDRPLWVNILAGFILAVGVFSIFILSLNWITHHGKSKAVPSVVGKTYDEAQSILSKTRENLEFPLRRHWIKVSHQKMDELVKEALEDVGLAHTINMMPAELSGGMRKRIALARTLILKPEIILYDEPTTGLDPITGKGIIELMVEIQKKYHSSSIIISHDMNCVKTASDRVIMLIDGRCYAEGTYEELIKMTDPKIKEFFE